MRKFAPMMAATVVIVIVIVIAIALSGCSTAAVEPSGPVNLTLWTGGSAVDLVDSLTCPTADPPDKNLG